MNAKKAKALRKVVKNLMNHQTPDGQRISAETKYDENHVNRKVIEIDVPNKDGSGFMKQSVPIAAGTITVDKRCKRGLYIHLKKAMKKQQSHV